MVCIWEKIKLTFFLFFFFLEHGETKSIVLPVHNYYFSKAFYKERKRRKGIREEGAFLPLRRVSCSTAEGAGGLVK